MKEAEFELIANKIADILPNKSNSIQPKSTRLKVLTKNISDFFGMAFTHRDKTKYFKKFFSIL